MQIIVHFDCNIQKDLPITSQLFHTTFPFIN